MGFSSRLLSFFFYGFLIHLVNPTIAQRDPYVLHECSTNGNVSSNSAYRANLNSLLSNLSSKSQIDNGFYINYPDSSEVNAIALCRGDLTATDCRSCVNMSAHELLVLCPNEKEGIIWYMNCTVRYSNNSILGVMEIEPMTSLMSVANVSEESGTYKQVLSGLLDGLMSKAASGDSLRKLAIGAANSTYFNLYALLQCTPDLDEQDCSNCLNQTIRYLPECCGDTTGARVLTPSCNLRYEDYRFYDNTTDELPPSSYLPPPPPTPLPPAAAEGMLPFSSFILQENLNSILKKKKKKRLAVTHVRQFLQVGYFFNYSWTCLHLFPSFAFRTNVGLVRWFHTCNCKIS
jgi:hypothetical protein